MLTFTPHSHFAASEGSHQRGAKDFYLLFPFIEESAYNVIEKVRGGEERSDSAA